MFFLLSILTYNAAIPMDALASKLIQGLHDLNDGKYIEARNSLEMVYRDSQQESGLRAAAARPLALIFLKGLGVNIDHQKALKYANEAYNIAKKLFHVSNNDAPRIVYALAASYLGRIYRDALGVEQDNKKALEYFTDVYNASEYKSDIQELQQLQTASAYDLGAIYRDLGDRTRAIEFFERARALEEYIPEIGVMATDALKELQSKDLADIEFGDKSRRLFDLQFSARLNGKKFSELIDLAKKHSTEFILARVMIRDAENALSSVYCGANDLISWLWGPTALDAFGKINDEEVLVLNAARKTHRSDIVEVQFFEWNPNQRLFQYIFNDKELFEGYSGRRKRLFLCTQNYNKPAIQIIASFSLSEMFFLGLGGPKDLTKANDLINFVLKQHNLSPRLATGAKIRAARIDLDLGLEYYKNNQFDLAMKHLKRAGFQKVDGSVQLPALMLLAKIYEQKKEFKQTLFCIETIITLESAPSSRKSYYEKLKKDIETKLKKQSSPIVAEKTTELVAKGAKSVAAAKKHKKKKKIKAKAKKVQSQESSIAPAPDILAQPTAVAMIPVETPLPAVETEDKQPSQTTQLSEEQISNLEEDNVFKISALIDAEKVKSLLTEFDKSFADYSNNRRHTSYLRNAKEALKKAEELHIDDPELQARIADAQMALKKLHTEKEEELKAESTVSKRRVFDPFGVEKDIAPNLQKKLKSSLEELAENPSGSDSKQIKGTKQNIRRIRIGDYRLFYIVTPDRICLLKIVKRDEAYTPKNLEQYDTRATRILNRIEEEKKLPPKEKEEAY
jgi:mRNA-degrading endonuclease RelE of RelBE toxin-antitoxin system/TPR repeat protein